MNALLEYWRLTKPGIVRGNLIVATAAFLFASDGKIDWWLLIWTVLGIGLVIASGCVANNYLDKDIDSRMDRTKSRAMVSKSISMKAAVVYAVILGLIGFGILFLLVNWHVAAVGLFGFLFYVIVYGYAKRRSVHGTLVGTVPGATPPLAGYLAVTSLFDWVALLLFMTMVFWQMPHFYSIAILRIKDYKKANLPLLPIVASIKQTKYQIIAYLGAFIFTITLYFGFDLVGYSYIIIMLVAVIWWSMLAFRGFDLSDKKSTRWAGKMFGRSLAVLTIFSLLISFNWLLP